jgi:hypothetical protein
MNGFRVFMTGEENPETVTINIYNPSPAELDMIKNLSEKGVLTTLTNIVEAKIEPPKPEMVEDADREECRKFVNDYLTDSHGRLGDALLLRMFKTCSSRKAEPGAYASFAEALKTMREDDKMACYEAWLKELSPAS